MRVLFLAIAFAAWTVAICRADAPEILVGSEVEFPPYAAIDNQGQATGFSIDLIRAVAETMGLTVNLSTGSWDDVWNRLVDGRIDVLPIVAKLPERTRLVDFSFPHTETFDAFFVSDGKPNLDDLAAAKNKEIVVMRSDYAHHALLEKKFEGKIILVDTIPEGLRLVSSGKHDAFLCSKLIGTLAIKEHNIKGLSAGPPIPDYKRIFSFAVKKGNAELLEKLNQGLHIVKLNGEYERIYRKWLDTDEPWKKFSKYFYPALIVLLALSLTAAGMLFILKRMVNQRTRQLAESNDALYRAGEELEERVSVRTAELLRSNDALQKEIAERRQAEEALRQSEERLQQALRVSRSFTFEWRQDTDKVLRSESCATILNLSGNEITHDTGRRFFQRVHPDDRSRFSRILNELTPAENSYTTEYRFIRGDGTTVVLDEVGQAIFCEARLERVVGVTTDVTERKQVEEALRQSRDQFQVMGETVPYGVWLCDPDGGLRYSSRSFLDLLDMTNEEQQQFGWTKRLMPEDVEPTMKKWLDCCATGTAFEHEHRIVDRYGKVHVILSKGLPVRGRDGEIFCWTGVNLDITERKQIEKALESSERKYRQIFETNNSMMVIVTLAGGRIIDANPTFCRVLGYAREALIGNTVLGMGLWVDLDYREILIDRLQAEDWLDREEVRMRTKAGDVRVALLSAVCTDISEERCIVASLIDITDRKRFEEQLQTLNEELEQRVEKRTRELQESQRQVLHAEKLSAIGRLSASIAHEFNNPLQGIMTILKGFQKTLVLEEHDRILLDLAFSESERMKNLIRSLQDFNRPSSGRKVFMDVHATLDSLILLSKSDLKRKGITAILNYDKALPQILAIPDQIKQVFLNLLQNAADACSGGNGMITISTCQEDKRIAVAIQDNGTGIAPDKLTQIFQPFFTTKSAIKGTGLGLSICHGIVQQHQGEICVESEPGKGSTFTVLLPIAGDST